ncbi:sugar ABC transporter ATP-binding protein [Planomonospora venezuelensis]|uniref:Ribose transport system ATP-binding protein n=1 Tax=Planomonospora venezuelensis TaxID=1999 RepID=A0A841DB14_PLAVE|nr:sugar ABC transporter ATP-binding protein [Planomonospora venezuelensis]MBB5966023.1 ribose transport system ATP-binding protein [Planomonospora venezuelensis]GIN02368.1 sugar ABC transporter ATP-binding protein [Planomonospora venezuelensis]
MAASDRVVEAAGIVKDFPGVRALDHVSFSLARGEVHALVGENGAGKSTLVKVLTGVYRPDAGRLRLHGEEVRFTGPPEAQRAGISTIYQEVNLVPQMSVARNLFLGREPRSRFGLIDFAAMRRLSGEILGEYGLSLNVHRPLGAFGPGVRQLVALARAVQADARVVVMDEPTSSLEPREVETLFAAIARLRAQDRSVIYVSHRLEELYRLCDRVTVLRDGRVVHTGPVAGLDRLRLVSLMLGRNPADIAERGTTSFTGSHPEPADTPVLRATNLVRAPDLKGVSLAIRPGEVVGLGGLVGSGRSETAKAIAGALPLDSGEVTVAGLPVRGRTVRNAIRAGINLLPENRRTEGLIPSLSVRENIALAALPRLSRAGIVSEHRIDRVVETFVRRLGIKVTGPGQRVAELSGGNQQKVLLARWLAMNPKVLLLDEPTRGIDVGTKAEVQAFIDELAVEGLAVLLVSSDLEELVEGSDRIVVLRDGVVVAELNGPDVTADVVMAAMATPPP